MMNETYTDSPLARQCATLDGLRRLVRFLEQHPECLGGHGSNIRVAHHAASPADFLAVEHALENEQRIQCGPYLVSERDFGGGVVLGVQIAASDLIATPARVAEVLDLPDDDPTDDWTEQDWREEREAQRFDREWTDR